MNKYFITLKPLTPFFFGGENTFGDGKVNYSVCSNYLPQQTTILGMLRHELLIQNELIGTDPEKANWKSLIGDNSFQKLNGKFVDDFGAIINISPVFISNGVKHYTTQALDWAYYEVDNKEKINNCTVKHKKIAPLSVDFETNSDEFVMYDDSPEGTPVLLVDNKPYDPKHGLISLLVSSDGKNLRKWDYDDPMEFDKSHGFENGFFIKHEQVGIHREITKRRDDKGDFYKQIFYKLVDDFCFAFFVEMELPPGIMFNSRIITMAGERSVFKMDVDDAKGINFENLFVENTFKEKHHRKKTTIILTSNCLCSDSIMNNCEFAINYDVNFQNVVTQQHNNVNYDAFQKGGITKSGENLTLMKRGTVLYPKADKIADVENTLKNDAFNKIGYNKYLIIT